MNTSHSSTGLSPVRAEAALEDIAAILASAGLTTENDPRPLSSWLRPVQSGR